MQDELGFKYHKSHPVDEGFGQGNSFCWRCSKKNKGCKATIVTLENRILRQNNQHNHLPEIFPT
eukprot:11675.XXX_695389_695580_1 [CDS] Oithona nana genome sequencing.